MRRTGPIKIRYTLTRKTTGRKVNRQRSCGISQAEAMRIQSEINSARHDLINAQVAAEEASKEVAAKAPEVTKAAEQAKPTPEGDNNYSIFDFDDVITDGLSKMKAQADKMRNFEFKTPDCDPGQIFKNLGDGIDTLVGSAGEDTTLGAGGDELVGEQQKEAESVYYENPTKEEVDMKLEGLAKQYAIPSRALRALIAAESDYRQFTNGKPLISPNSNSSAIGLGQITATTAGYYSADYMRLGVDWLYNLEVSVEIFYAGWNHPWNRNIMDDRVRSARAYGMYQDGFEPNFNVTGLPRDTYKRKPRGLIGSKWEKRYLSYY